MMNTEEPIFRNPRVIFEEQAGNIIQDPLNEARRIIFWDIIMLILPFVGMYPLYMKCNKDIRYSMIPYSIIGIISTVFYCFLSSKTEEFAENLRLISYYITMRKVLLLVHGAVLTYFLYFVITEWNRPQHADYGLVHSLTLMILVVLFIPCVLIYVIWLVLTFKGIIRFIQEDQHK